MEAMNSPEWRIGYYTLESQTHAAPWVAMGLVWAVQTLDITPFHSYQQ